MKKLETIINYTSSWTGQVASFLVLPLMVVVVYAVIMRYVFRNPPSWGFDVSRELFGSFIVLGGAYITLHRSLINVDILWKRFPPRIAAVVDMITYLFGLFFLGSLVWKGIPQAILSTKILEKSMDLSIYLFPFRIMFVIGSLIFLLQLIVHYSRIIRTVAGRAEKS